MSRTLPMNSGSVLSFQVSTTCGLRPNTRQIRDTDDRLVYRGTDNHLYELAYVANVPSPHWGWADLNIAVGGGGAPPAAEAPIIYQTNFVNQGPTARLVYRGGNDHLYELAYVANVPSPHWGWADLNIAAGGGGAPPAAEAPIIYQTNFVNQGPTARLVYQGGNDHLYELAYVGSNPGWGWVDLNVAAGG